MLDSYVPLCRPRRSVVAKTGGGKTDLSKVGLNSIENDVVKQNLMGKSRYMEKKGWTDSQGRKGKVRSYGQSRATDTGGS